MAEVDIRSEFIISARGQNFVRFAGVLDAAHQAGLKSLTATIVQIPSPENGYLAVVTATAEFADGRVFTDVGDCSPASTSAAMAVHSLRMAATRAEGRAMGRGLNISVALIEELADDDEMAGAKRANGQAGNGQAAVRAPQSPAGAAAGAARRDAAPAAGGGGEAAAVCSWAECGALLSGNENTMSRHKFHQPLCREHTRLMEAEQKKAAAQG